MSILEDAWGAVSNPTNLLRVIPYMGWTTMLIDYLPGLLAPAANVALTSTPGLVRGEGFSDAFVAEYTWHLQQVLKYGGADAAAQVNREYDAGKATDGLVDKDTFAKLKQQGISAQDALTQLHTSPEDIAKKLGVRPDVAAMILNAALHERVYDVDRQFDPATGALKPTIKLGALGAGPLMPADNSSTYLAGRYKDAQDARAAAETKLLQLQVRAAAANLVQTARDELAAARRNEDFHKTLLDTAIAKEQASATAERTARSAAGAPLGDVPDGSVGVSLGPPLAVALGPVDGVRSLAGGLATLALLTLPVWGAYLYLRHAKAP